MSSDVLHGKSAGELFDALAHEYLDVRTEVDWDPFPHVAAALGSGELDGKRILDVGCGPGEVPEMLVARGADVVGVDLSLRMCELAAEKVPGAAFIPHDLAEGLPFEDGSFDASIALGCVEYVEDVEFACAELARVVRPGGVVLYVVELCGDGIPGGDARSILFLDEWVRYRRSLEEVRAQAEQWLDAPQIDLVPGYILVDEDNGQDKGEYADAPRERIAYARVIGLRIDR